MDKLTCYLAKDGSYTFLPYDLPEGKSGNIEISKQLVKKGTRMSIISLRGALFMGLKPAAAILDRDVYVHWLKEEGYGSWMSTTPLEVEQATRQLARAHGTVLVGGLGLGLAVCLLVMNRNVTGIVVVEKNPDVVKLVSKYVPREQKPVFYVTQDLFTYLRKLKRKRVKRVFDFAFYDIWCNPNQWTHTKVVMPLRKLSIDIVPQNMIECWNELEMIGQTEQSLRTRIMLEYSEGLPKTGQLDKLRWNIRTMSKQEFAEVREVNRDTWPFYQWIRHVKPSQQEANDEVEYYMKALQNAETWESKWKYYEQLRH